MATSTVLITGANSGIGRACAQAFASKGWNVAATMRSLENAQALSNIRNVHTYQLDVTDAASVSRAFSDVEQAHGRIDVVVNNAGYGLMGVFELMTDEQLRDQMETNVLGLMRVTREAILRMRPHGAGRIIQISSMGGRMTFPLYAPYHATKWAVEGFTESLHYELRDLGIAVKLVEPGLIKTDFAGRSGVAVLPEGASPYGAFVAKFGAAATKALADAVSPTIVADAVLQAATDSSEKMRYPVGKPAPMLLRLRKLLSDKAFFSAIRKAYKI